MSKTKQELLEAIEVKELAMLNELDTTMLRQYIQDWFPDTEIEVNESRHELITQYMTDFMLWQEDKSEEELQDKLSQYK